jgi:hypothetical protein
MLGLARMNVTPSVMRRAYGPPAIQLLGGSGRVHVRELPTVDDVGRTDSVIFPLETSCRALCTELKLQLNGRVRVGLVPQLKKQLRNPARNRLEPMQADMAADAQGYEELRRIIVAPSMVDVQPC